MDGWCQVPEIWVSGTPNSEALRFWCQALKKDVRHPDSDLILNFEITPRELGVFLVCQTDIKLDRRIRNLTSPKKK